MQPSTSVLDITANLPSRPHSTWRLALTWFFRCKCPHLSTPFLPDILDKIRANAVTVCVFRIWYNFCLLRLLEPFARDPASLEGGLPPSLSRDATPHTVCRQASEAIISLTSAYQYRYSLMYLPPFLPYMVFAAALH